MGGLIQKKLVPGGFLGRQGMRHADPSESSRLSASAIDHKPLIESCMLRLAGTVQAALMRSLTRALVLVVLSPALFSVSGCGSGYRGYKDAPYTVKGQRYHPMAPQEAVGYDEVGTASHYKGGFLFFPGKTATGEKIYPWSHGAAHKTLPLPCRVRITNLENGRRVKVRVNDRGPFIPGRILDVTAATAKRLGFHAQGLAEVKVEVLSVGDGRYRIR